MPLSLLSEKTPGNYRRAFPRSPVQDERIRSASELAAGDDVNAEVDVSRRWVDDAAFNQPEIAFKAGQRFVGFFFVGCVKSQQVFGFAVAEANTKDIALGFKLGHETPRGYCVGWVQRCGINVRAALPTRPATRNEKGTCDFSQVPDSVNLTAVEEELRR